MGGGCLFSTVVFNDLRWEVVVCFVDISEIVDHHCSNYLFRSIFLCSFY